MRILCFTLLALLAPLSVASDAIPHHHLALFLGGGNEEKKDKDEKTWAVGLEYEYRFSERFGIGVAYEELGEDAVRNQAIVVPLSIHVGGHWRLFTGPGYEWHGNKEKYLWRAGAGYAFRPGGHWTIAPGALVDVVENGDKTWLLGVDIGYHF